MIVAPTLEEVEQLYLRSVGSEAFDGIESVV